MLPHCEFRVKLASRSGEALHRRCVSRTIRESVPFFIVLDQKDRLLKWSATRTFSSHWLTAQMRLPKLCYSYVELMVAEIELIIFRLKVECATDWAKPVKSHIW